MRRGIIVVVVIAATLIPTVWGMVRADAAFDEDRPVLETIGSDPPIVIFGRGRATLRGLPEVCVIAEYPPPHLEQYGLTRPVLQTDIELQLRQQGITVMPEKKHFSIGRPKLGVSISSAEEGDMAATYIQIYVGQVVPLGVREGRKIICNAAITWTAGTLVLGGPDQSQQVRDTVKDLVAEFINDYLAVNPRHGETRE